MSKIGKLPVAIPSAVKINLDDQQIKVSGPKGELVLNIPDKIKVIFNHQDNQIVVSRLTSDKKTKANHGTTRAHINNMVTGVQKPWIKQLEIRGTGYKAILNGDKLTLTVGFIHPVDILIPATIQIQVEDETKITVSGPDITLVGQVASNIRKAKKPEPYQGKGIRYVDEHIKIKPGKAAKTED